MKASFPIVMETTFLRKNGNHLSYRVMETGFPMKNEICVMEIGFSYVKRLSYENIEAGFLIKKWKQAFLRKHKNMLSYRKGLSHEVIETDFLMET